MGNRVSLKKIAKISRISSEVLNTVPTDHPTDTDIKMPRTAVKEPTLKDIMDKLLLNEESGKERADALDQRLDTISGKLDTFKAEQDCLKSVMKEVRLEVTINECLTKFNAGKIEQLEYRLELNDRDSRRLNLVIKGIYEDRTISLPQVVNSLFADLQIGYQLKRFANASKSGGRNP